MKTIKVLSMFLISFMIILFNTEIIKSQNLKDNPPEGWFKAGSKPELYEVGKTREYRNGIAYIKSIVDSVPGFGTLMQWITANYYKDTRLKLTAKIKTQDVISWCGLWMRVDDVSGNTLAFDNMWEKPIKGSNDWKEYSIILNTTDSSYTISFGVLLQSTGQVWFDDMKFEIIDQSGAVIKKDLPLSGTGVPVNLNFEK